MHVFLKLINIDLKSVHSVGLHYIIVPQCAVQKHIKNFTNFIASVMKLPSFGLTLTSYMEDICSKNLAGAKLSTATDSRTILDYCSVDAVHQIYLNWS